MTQLGLIMPLAVSFTADSYIEYFIIFSIGICIAICYALYNKVVLGKFVRTLLTSQANNEETAKKLEDIGYSNNAVIKQALRNNVTFKRYITNCENGYYISDENIEMMNKRFDDKNTDARAVFIAIALIVITIIIIWFVFPPLLNYVFETFS